MEAGGRAAPVEGRRAARRARRDRPADRGGPRPGPGRPADHPRDGWRREDRGVADLRLPHVRRRPQRGCTADRRSAALLVARRAPAGALALRRAPLRVSRACARRASASSGAARAGPRAPWAIRPARRSSASARLRAWLRASWATARTTGPQRAMMRRFCGVVERAEAATSKLASMREAVTLACWPPGPDERLARTRPRRAGSTGRG